MYLQIFSISVLFHSWSACGLTILPHGPHSRNNPPQSGTINEVDRVQNTCASKEDIKDLLDEMKQELMNELKAVRMLVNESQNDGREGKHYKL